MRNGHATPRHYLDEYENNVTAPQEYLITPCRCGVGLCPNCGPRKARAYYAKYHEAVASFRHPVYITLTIAPAAFPDALTAFKAAQKLRCVPVFIQRLRRAYPHLVIPFVAALHSQPETKYPHWHLIVDANRLDAVVVADAWSNVAAKVLADVSLGGTHMENISAGDIDRVLNYLLHQMRRPDLLCGSWSWLLDHSTVRFVTASRGLVAPRISKPCKSYSPKSTKSGTAGSEPKYRPRRSLRQRLTSCESALNVFLVTPKDQILGGKPLYVGTIPQRMHDIRGHFSNAGLEEGGHLQIAANPSSTAQLVECGLRKYCDYIRPVTPNAKPITSPPPLIAAGPAAASPIIAPAPTASAAATDASCPCTFLVHAHTGPPQ